MLVDRLESLDRKHKELHNQIEALEAEKAPDKYVTPLKIRKLRIKDEIELLRKQIAQNG